MMRNYYLEVAIHAALTAGAVLRDNLSQPHQLVFKGATDLVTEMDRQAESIILTILRDRFPDHGILSEEKGRIKQNREKFLWLIDPLDGTTNYAHGFPWYAVSIALQEDNTVIAAVVYHPEMEELFSATRGGGAFLNKQKIAVSQQTALGQSLLATGFPYNIQQKSEKNIENFTALLLQSQGIRRAGAAALDLCYTACGRFDGFWEFGLAPWDTAAGSLILTEAGGTITTFHGKPYSPFNETVVASNGSIHQSLLRVLNKFSRSTTK
ncbi:inositol monophosphatase family protein [candidate division CSSED10-310 bacterium]|uniref:Inositol-1-monophosphatase n=1 Tax=candidate division CSSED10-310 bacterium TaxID=2855610 RepID=A0ABV6Z2V7_UNCC1